MALIYTRDDERRRITIQISGYVETHHVVEAIERQAAEGTWTYAVLCDVRGTSWLPSRDDLDRLLRTVEWGRSTSGERGPVAIVVAGPAALQIARDYSRRANMIARTEAFLDPSNATLWLDQVLATRAASGLART
jgi:hypothetical protein